MPKVRYIGPGSQSDQRTMEVSDQELPSIMATGLWEEMKKSGKTAAKNEEVDNG